MCVAFCRQTLSAEKFEVGAGVNTGGAIVVDCASQQIASTAKHKQRLAIVDHCEQLTSTLDDSRFAASGC